MEFNREWEEKVAWLFSNIPDDDFVQVVCVEHKRFIPCRTCMYQGPAKVPYSANPMDVKLVRIHQEAKNADQH